MAEVSLKTKRKENQEKWKQKKTKVVCSDISSAAQNTIYELEATLHGSINKLKKSLSRVDGQYNFQSEYYRERNLQANFSYAAYENGTI